MKLENIMLSEKKNRKKPDTKAHIFYNVISMKYIN